MELAVLAADRLYRPLHGRTIRPMLLTHGGTEVEVNVRNRERGGKKSHNHTISIARMNDVDLLATRPTPPPPIECAMLHLQHVKNGGGPEYKKTRSHTHTLTEETPVKVLFLFIR